VSVLDRGQMSGLAGARETYIDPFTNCRLASTISRVRGVSGRFRVVSGDRGNIDDTDGDRNVASGQSAEGSPEVTN
jgi:hypothetical protein